MATEAGAKHRPLHEALRERSKRQWIRACVLKRRIPWCDADDVAQEVALEMSTAEAHLVVPEGQHCEEAWRVLLWRIPAPRLPVLLHQVRRQHVRQHVL